MAGGTRDDLGINGGLEALGSKFDRLAAESNEGMRKLSEEFQNKIDGLDGKLQARMEITNLQPSDASKLITSGQPLQQPPKWSGLCAAPAAGNISREAIPSAQQPSQPFGSKSAAGSVRMQWALPTLQDKTELRAKLTREHDSLLWQLNEHHLQLLNSFFPSALNGEEKLPVPPEEFEPKQNMIVSAFVQTDACEFAPINDAIRTDIVRVAEPCAMQPTISVPVPTPLPPPKELTAKEISLTLNKTTAIAMQGVFNTELSCLVRFEHFVVGPIFETIFAMLIMANAIVMAFEAQYNGFDNGFKLKHSSATRAAKDVWPGAESAFQILEISFGSLFVFELIIKILVMRFKFITSWWNWLDFIIVVSWVLDAGFQVKSFLNPMMLRLFRLVKLLRVAKLFKSFSSFDSLSLLLGSLKASASILFWSIVVMFVLQMVAALFFCQVLQEYIVEGTHHGRIEVYDRFGTFTRAFVTMLELTIGQWGPVLQLLVQNVSEWYAIFVIVYVLCVSFATIKVISGVFILETQKLAASDEDILIMQKDRANSRLEANILSVFKEIDSSGEGSLDREEFQRIIRDDRVRTYLAALELETQHCEGLFEQLDTDHDESITFREFMGGVCRLKGPAKSADLTTLAFKQAILAETIQRIADVIDVKLGDGLTHHTQAFSPAADAEV